MPVIAGRPSAPPPVEIPGVGFATARFIAPDGAEWPLTNEALGWFTLADGVSGLDVTPYDLTKDSYPRGGSRLRHRQPAERTIVWPLHVYGDTIPSSSSGGGRSARRWRARCTTGRDGWRSPARTGHAAASP